MTQSLEDRMPKDKEKIHPLEGKYIIFIYRECDREDEGETLVVYQLRNNKLENICNLICHLDPSDLNYESVYDKKTGEHITPTELAFRVLERRGIKEVFSVIRSKIFFGIPFLWYQTGDAVEENGDCIDWAEYDSIFEGEGYYNDLKARGIEVKMFTEEE